MPTRTTAAASRDRSYYLDVASRAEFKSVNSSNVNTIAYYPAEALLFIEFLPSGKQGYSLYVYREFPSEWWDTMQVSPSIGQFVWYAIREEGADRLFDPLRLY